MNHTNAGGTTGNPSGAEETIKRHEHHKSITMADIAKAAGVSQGAISSLLNDRDYGIRVSEKTRDRVFKACRDLAYVPNDLRAVVRMYPERGETTILISSDFANGVTNPFLARFVKGLMDTSENPSQPVTLAQYKPSANYSIDPVPHPVSWGTASKFICVGKPNMSLLQSILRRGYPAVCVGYELTMAGVTSIVPDFAEASRLAMEYLFKLGHQRIAILSGTFGATEQSIIEMNRGVRVAFDHAGVAIEAQHIVYGDLTFQNGFKSAEALLTRQPRPTAVVCFNDAAAAGVIARAHEKGMKLPEELSVLGCGDDAYSENLHPALTTVHLPAEEMGAAAAKEVEHRASLRDEGIIESKNIVMPVRLVERDSCAAPAV